jgi:hypothetical protein
MAYTPELDKRYSGALRRIAWTYRVPMTEALKGILDLASKYMDRSTVCGACRDKSFCKACPFNQDRQPC